MVDLKCPECGSKRLIKFGKRWIRRRQIQQWQCRNCGRITVYPKKGG